jgi:hypothetical protein
MDAHHEAMKAHHEAMKAHHEAMEAHHEGMETHTGAIRGSHRGHLEQLQLWHKSMHDK